MIAFPFPAAPPDERIESYRVELGLDRCRYVPRVHQVIGIRAIVNKPAFFLADEMGSGKTKQAIDAAQILFMLGVIDRVVVVCPSSVRSVWVDNELGELAKHLWGTTRAEVQQYHSKMTTWQWGLDNEPAARRMSWVVTNYDFIRSKERLGKLCAWAEGAKTLLILDESTAVKNPTAKQTKACLQLRGACQRVLLLNGTPVSNSLMDLFSQARIMGPRVLECKTQLEFKARYATMGGYKQKEIVSWRNIEDLQQRLAPFVLRRLKKDCLDLPPKLEPITLEAPLTPVTWGHYKQMRDKMVTWLSDNDASVATQAITKILRLSQITSGFLGGVEAILSREESPARDARPDWVEEAPIEVVDFGGKVQEVGREKLDTFLAWYTAAAEADPELKLLVWCRFVPEVLRLEAELRGLKHLSVTTGMIVGGQKDADRSYAKRLLDPRAVPAGLVVVVGTPSSGGKGTTLTASHTVMRVSRDYNMSDVQQSDDRVHRDGQTQSVAYFDIMATGPDGQKTIDHVIALANLRKENLATWTASAWVKALTEE